VRVLIATGPEPPDRQDRKQRAREEKRRDHRESHRQRQRHEERPRDAGHEERWHEHRDDAEHRKQARGHDLGARIEYRPSNGRAFCEMRVNVLDGDCCLVDENANR
jgi:hypothetical protein